MNAPLADPPCRPTLPPLFLAAASAWIAICLAEELTWQAYAGTLDAGSCMPGASAVLFVAILGIILTWRAFARSGHVSTFYFTRSGMMLVLIAFVCAFVCGLAGWGGWDKDVSRLAELLERGERIELDLTGDAAIRDYGAVSTAQIGQGSQAIRVRLIWPEDTEPLFAGHRIAVTASLSMPKIDEGGRWSHRNGFAGTLRTKHVEELGYSPGLRGAVTSFRDESFARITTMSGDAAGLLAGVLLGNKTIYAGSELEQAFQTTGLAHLMAVSGTHLAIVTMLLSVVLAKTPLRRRTRSAILIIALVIYVAITGFAASALRACTMCTVALVLGMLGQRPYMLSGLALCVFVFLGLSPSIAFSLGFQLSVLSVLGLVIFAGLARHWLEHALPRLPASISSSVAATIAASFMTLPVTVSTFAQLPLISPVANLLAAPLITAALCLGVAALVIGIFLAPVGTLLLHGAGAIASCCASLVRILADLPFACLPLSIGTHALAIIFCMLLIVLWIAWPLPRRPEAHDNPCTSVRRLGTLSGTCAAFALPVILAFALGFGQLGASTGTSGSRIVMLDVGQGDSMLIQSEGASILVDTGENGDVLLRELAEQGVTHLDAIVITHKDADHAGALGELAGVVAVDHAYVHADLLDEETLMAKVLESAQWATSGRGAEGVLPGSILQAGEFSLTIIAPHDGGKSENDDSLVGLLEFDANSDGSIEARGLLTGDAESEALEDVAPLAGDIDFLKVAHHGSKGGLTDEQLEELSPEIALISVGADNKYGHPTAETLHMLKGAGARIYRTDENGAISITFGDGGMRVATER